MIHCSINFKILAKRTPNGRYLRKHITLIVTKKITALPKAQSFIAKP